MYKTKQPTSLSVVWLDNGVVLDDLAHLECVWALWAFTDLEAYFVTFTKLIETGVYELIAVEEKILVLSFYFNEAETLVGESSDCAFLHSDMLKSG